MIKPLFPKSMRKYIRFQKARIRKGTLDTKKQKELIDELYKKLTAKPEKKVEKPKKKEEKSKKAPVVKKK